MEKWEITSIIYDGNLEKVKELFESEELTDDEKNHVLVTAVKDNKIEMVSFCLSSGVNPNEVFDEDGSSVWFDCIYHRNIEMAKLLIENGLDVNLIDKLGEMALPKACFDMNIDMVRLLIENGADVKAREVNGSTAILVAADRSIEIVKLLLENGAEINVREEELGQTPLRQAVFVNNVDMVRFLLDNGADVNIKDNEGKTPYDIAPNKEIKELLNQYK